MIQWTRRSISLLALATVSGLALAQDGGDTLTLGEPIARSIEKEGVHNYTLTLSESEFVYLVADQHTVDVVVTVFNPAGEKIGTYDGPARGGENVQFFSKEAGDYRVEIKAFEDQAGDYEVEVRRAEPKATTPEGLVEQLIAPYDDPEVPGGVIAIARDGEVTYARAFGSANLRYGIPWAIDTRTNIGSTSKQFTAFAICLLAERGELSLDDDVRKHIPELPDLGETVTLRHLLTHTSGYREFLNTLYMSGRRIDRGDSIDRKELIEVVQRQPALQNSPGAEWNYNNTGFGLLAAVVERVTGEAFPDWMETNVFHPVGMYDTFVRHDQSEIIPNSSQGYSPAEEGGFTDSRDLGGAMGAGGIYSTVADLAKWMDNLATGAYGGTHIVEQMKSPYTLTNGKSTNYGFGLFIDKQDGLDRVQHGGADTAHRSNFLYYPALDAGVVTQSNHAAFDGSVANRIAGAFFEKEIEALGINKAPEEQAEETPAGEFDPASFDPESFDAFVGRFEMEEVPGFVLEFTREDDHYFTQATNQPKLEIFPIAPNRFDLRVVEANVEFHVDDDGGVETITLHQNGAHPANRVEDKWEPDDEALAVYAGRYFSEELETFFELVVEDSTLVLKHRRLDPITLKANKRDQFAGSMPIALVDFERDAEGNVTAFLASNGRTKDVRFEKAK